MPHPYQYHLAVRHVCMFLTCHTVCIAVVRTGPSSDTKNKARSGFSGYMIDYVQHAKETTITVKR